jgi:death-on-curing family protein
LADGTLFYLELAAQAAVLLYHVAKAHACHDGNKRIAAALTLLFVRLNGQRMYIPDDELVALTFYAADSEPRNREGVLEQLTEWIQSRLRLTLDGGSQTGRA